MRLPRSPETVSRICASDGGFSRWAYGACTASNNAITTAVWTGVLLMTLCCVDGSLS